MADQCLSNPSSLPSSSVRWTALLRPVLWGTLPRTLIHGLWDTILWVAWCCSLLAWWWTFILITFCATSGSQETLDTKYQKVSVYSYDTKEVGLLSRLKHVGCTVPWYKLEGGNIFIYLQAGSCKRTVYLIHICYICTPLDKLTAAAILLSSFKGGMFNFVSGANYFGETVEWVGFALACSTLAAAAFAFFTAVFLGGRAITHHR